MKLTFQEFAKKMYKLNHESNPYVIEEGWVYHVEEVIKSGQNVSDRVLNCHSEIYFDQTGIAHYRNSYIGWLKMKIYITILIGIAIFFIPILIVGILQTKKCRPDADKAIQTICEELQKL